MRSETTRTIELDRLPDDDEQDEPLAWQEHGLTIHNLHYPLYARLRSPHCAVAGEIRLYRDAEAVRVQDYVSLDVLVALAVPDRVRERYVIAAEGKAPDLVVEVLSQSSTDNGDLTRKRDTYQSLGVREYVVVDPLGKFAPEPRLQAWRFRDAAGQVLPEPIYVLPGADGVLHSAVIPFGWTVRDDWVRLVDVGTDEVLPLLWEVDERLRAAEEAQRRAERLREQLEHEVERLRRQLEDRG